MNLESFKLCYQSCLRRINNKAKSISDITSQENEKNPSTNDSIVGILRILSVYTKDLNIPTDHCYYTNMMEIILKFICFNHVSFVRHHD